MNRRDREIRYNSEPGLDYRRYDGYNRDDEHYHSARNLTDRFERDYQRERGHRDQYHPQHTYHEGNMGNAYERLSREDRDYGNDTRNRRDDYWDRNRGYSDNTGRDRDNRYSGFWDSNRGEQDRYSSGRGYGDRMENYGASDRYNNAPNRNDYPRAGEQNYYPGSGGDTRRSRYESRNDLDWRDSDRDRYQANRYY
ncbi:hypothetical protein [Pontibacter actiniarum]|uniref:Uncharacterized protein n=1 Tax=Pontibacter actiniarum TaxID=323450 RepID=A0A1X9YP08_9BACT|nr:hypothetical protein [Pontibacter actiniarum]ARS34584.1 hypothetical protein CA264_03510 [Pontibacter actiniarum]